MPKYHRISDCLQAGQLAEGDEEDEHKLERMGLTPDWIIQVPFCRHLAGQMHLEWSVDA